MPGAANPTSTQNAFREAAKGAKIAKPHSGKAEGMHHGTLRNLGMRRASM